MLSVWLCVGLAAGLSGTGAVKFEDVTVVAGLDYAHWVPALCAPPCPEAPFMAAGAAAADFDGDGWVDLYVTRMFAPNLLFRNLRDGTFEEIGAAAGVDLDAYASGCTCGDVDNDGDVDLYISTLGTRNYLFINDGGGRFVEEADARGVMFASSSPRTRTGATFGDYDRDGALDLHTVEWSQSGALNRLCHNDGTGHFTDVTASAGLASVPVWGFSNGFADMDADGWPDLLIAADFGTSRLFRNLGDGTFADITETAGVGTDENGMGSTIGDIDNDGDLDWFVTSIYDPDHTCEQAGCNWGYTGNRLYLNDGAARFTDGTEAAGVRDGGWGWGASFFDFDNDGDLDLGMTNGILFPWTDVEDAFNQDPVRLWQNDGSGHMTEVSEAFGFTDTGSGKGFVVFDYDRDGDLDVFIANNGGRPVLYRNNGGNENAWLRIVLRGRETNSFGIGATIRVQATATSPTQMRQVSAHNNFMSQNETTVHFGLGPGVRLVRSVTVEWPVSGIIQTLTNVASNQLLVLTEQPAGDTIPAVSTWGFIAMILLIVTVRTIVFRRRAVCPARP